MKNKVTSITERVPQPVIIPDGLYNGTWSGHVIDVKIEGKSYALATEMGVKGINIKVVVEVKDGEATFDLSRNVCSDDDIINGSGLFHWNSSIKKDVKLKMVEWYNNLSSEEKEYVIDLRHEAAMDEYDSYCGEEL